MLPRSHKQEAFSVAYVHAVAAQAEVSCGEFDQDYGIDMYLRGIEQDNHLYLDSGPQIDLQLKSTTNAEIRDQEILYDLDIRAYNLLRKTPAQRPCLLVLLILPEDEQLWLRSPRTN